MSFVGCSRMRSDESRAPEGEWAFEVMREPIVSIFYNPHHRKWMAQTGSFPKQVFEFDTLGTAVEEMERIFHADRGAFAVSVKSVEASPSAFAEVIAAALRKQQ